MTQSRRLKVLHLLSGDLWAGAEAQVFTLVSRLIRMPDLDVHVILLNRHVLAEKLDSIGVPIEIMDEKTMSTAGIIRRLSEILKSQHFSILHTHRYKENILGALSARLTVRPALIKTVHGLPEPFRGFAGAKFRLYQAMDAIMTRLYFDKIICVSQEITARQTTAHGRNKAIYITNALDIEACKPTRDRQSVRRELGLDPDAPVIGTVGRLVPVKGLSVLLEAAVDLAPAVPHLKILIVGDGPERERLTEQVAATGLAGIVHLVGFRHDVADLLAAFDVFALPSLSEGLPMVLLEAMALQIPIVASRVGGVAEVLMDGESGLLVAPGEPGSLATACHRLLAEQHLATRLATAARQRLEQQYSADRMASAVAALYRTVVDG
jgi:L-malate glycosyltransferase